MTCSDFTQLAELRKIFSIILINSYPDYVIEKIIARKLKDFTSPTSHKKMRCLSSSALVGLSVGHKIKITAGVKKCFFGVEQRVIFTSRSLLSAIEKDVLSASLLSNVVYNFYCLCDNRHVGRTSQQLHDGVC